MSARDTSQVLDFLGSQVAAGFTILSWNGLGFDFDILAEESAQHDLCRQLAVTHVDLMFHVFCEKGFAVGLDAAAKALCARGKTKGMQAALAPQMWAEGRTQQVLKYVADDCQLTLDVAKSAGTDGRFAWITRRHRKQLLSDRRSLAHGSRSAAASGAGHILDDGAAVETGAIHGLA